MKRVVLILIPTLVIGFVIVKYLYEKSEAIDYINSVFAEHNMLSGYSSSPARYDIQLAERTAEGSFRLSGIASDKILYNKRFQRPSLQSDPLSLEQMLDSVSSTLASKPLEISSDLGQQILKIGLNYQRDKHSSFYEIPYDKVVYIPNYRNDYFKLSKYSIYPSGFVTNELSGNIGDYVYKLKETYYGDVYEVSSITKNLVRDSVIGFCIYLVAILILVLGYKEKTTKPLP